MAIKIQGSTIIDDSRKVINASHVGIGTTNPTVELDVDGNANISGISTLSGVKISSGIVTAVSGVVTYYGDGSNLTNIAAAGAIEGLTVIDQSGSTVGTAGSISSLSFEGSTAVTVTGTTGASGIATVLISAPGELNDLSDVTTKPTSVLIGTGVSTNSTENTVIGQEAGANINYRKNTFVGYQAGKWMTYEQNTAIGNQALGGATGSTSNAFDCVAIGDRALRLIEDNAHFNTAVGAGAGYALTSGRNNTLIGASAGVAVTTGRDNVCVGVNAGADISIGEDNICIGTFAGDEITTGSNNIVIGNDADASSATVSNEITLGNSSITKFRIPGLNLVHNSTGIGIGSTQPTAKVDVQGDVRISKAATNANPHLRLFAEDSNGSFIIAEHASDHPDLEFKTRVWDGSSGSTLSLFKGAAQETVGSSTFDGIGLEDNKAIIFGTGNDSYMRYDPTPGLLEIRTVVSEPITFGTNNVERLRISSGGNIGIGSTQPTAKLDVNGTLNVSGISTFSDHVNFDLGSGYNIEVDITNNLLRLTDDVKLRFGDASTTALEIYKNSAAGNSYIQNWIGDIVIRNNANGADVVIVSDDGSGGNADYFRADGSTGESILYHYGNQKLNTTGYGVTVSGGLNVSGVSTFQNSVTISGAGNTSTITGPSNLVLDPAAVGDATGTVTILGNLQVDGTQTIINSTTLEVDDKLVSIAKSATNATQANGAGLEINGASATLTYASTGDKWVFNKAPYYNTNRLLTTADEGSGNGLDADTLDGLDSLSFLRSDYAAIKSTGDLRFNNNIGITFGGSDNSRIFHDGTDLSLDLTAYVTDFKIRDGTTERYTFTKSGKLSLVDVNASGISTLGTVKISSGIVTAVSGVVTYYGDGSQLTGISAGSGISTTGIATFNNINATGVVTSTSFIRAGGTSSQFLKADGSIDSSVYLTSVSPTFWTETGYTGIGTTSAVGIGTRIEIIPYDTQNDGTLSFEGSAGQLFSVSNNLTTGSIFSVNDVSGIPSIDVDADGTIQLAPFSATELVGIGTTNPTAKLHVNGTVALGSSVYDTNGTFGGNGQVLSNVTGFGVSWTTVSGGGGSSVWSTSGNDAYYTTGNVGINSTSPTAKLDVNGTLNVTGVSTFNDAVTISRATTNTALSIRFGNSETGNLSPLASSFRVASVGTYDLGLVCNGGGGTTGDVVISTGGGNGKMALFTGTGTAELYYQDAKKFETTNTGIGVSGNIEKYDTLVGSGSTTVVGFAVTVATKSDHRYTGGVNGASSSGYYLDGIESPFLTFTPGRTYRFNQADNSNSNHQIRFYLEADKTTEYTVGVATHGTAGAAGAFTQIAVTESTPSILYYQCVNHAYMGNAAQTNGSTLVDGRHDTGVNASPEDPVHSLSVIGPESNIDLAIVPKGSGAFSLHIPDGTSAGGNKRGGNAVDLQTQRTNADDVAGSYGSFIAGIYNKVGTSAFYSAVVGGSYNRCIDNAADCIVVGGGQNEINSSSSSSGILAGTSNRVNGSYSAIIGGYRGTTKGINGIVVLPASGAPVGGGVTHGGVQATILNLARDTTDATPTVIASDNTAASTDNQLVLLNNSAVAFKGTCIAGVTGAGNTKAWEFRGAIKRGANAASTTLVGSVIKDVLAYDAGAAAWDVDFTADTTNGALKVTVTGEVAPYTIRWVCKIETTELAF